MAQLAPLRSIDEMAQQDPRLQCICCTDPGTLTCSGCRDAKYCSRECQEADYQFHKHLCKSFARFQPEHRPAPDMRRVVHFPADGEKPEFMWVPINTDIDDQMQLLDFSKIIDDDYWHAHRWYGTAENRLNGAPLGGIVSVSYDDEWTRRHLQNQAVITATNGKARMYPWGGPMICIYGDNKNAGTEDEDLATWGRIEDMNMRAYSFILNHIIAWNNFTKKHSLRLGKKVKAVKLLSNGQRSAGAPSAQVVKLPRMHPLFEAPNIPALTEAIGLPLLTMKCKGKSADSEAMRSDEAAALHVVIDPSSPDFAQPSPAMAAGGFGDVYFARADRKPLSPDTVEALAGFYLDYVKPWIGQAVGPTDDGMRVVARLKKRQKTLQQITPEIWSVFLAAWKSSNKSGDLEEETDSDAEEEKQRRITAATASIHPYYGAMG